MGVIKSDLLETIHALNPCVVGDRTLQNQPTQKEVALSNSVPITNLNKVL